MLKIRKGAKIIAVPLTERLGNGQTLIIITLEARSHSRCR